MLQDHSRSLRAPQSFQRYDHPSRVNAVHAARPFLFTVSMCAISFPSSCQQSSRGWRGRWSSHARWLQGCEDGSITQWDIETAQPVRSFVG